MWDLHTLLHSFIPFVTLQVYKQKVKHLLYEHQNNIAELKTEEVLAGKVMQKEHGEQEKELRRAVRALKVDYKEQELEHENLVKSLKLVCGHWPARLSVPLKILW